MLNVHASIMQLNVHVSMMQLNVHVSIMQLNVHVFIMQLNVKRATERRKPQEMTHVNQPFNKDLFNFTKIQSGEILFEMKDKDNPNHDVS